MTREEAIKYLIKPVATSTEIGEEKQKEFEAYNMAVEALTERQGHGRLIDADKLLQDLFIVDEEEWTTPEIRAILENAPNITPTERTGEWIDRNDEDVWNYCSVCSEQSIDLFDFCPNCGADMRGNDYQRQIEDLEHNMRYEPTYNPEDGSM